MEIDVKGIEFLSEKEKQILDKISNEHYEKIKKIIKTDFWIKIKIKVHKKTEKSRGCRFIIDVEVVFNAGFFGAGVENWDLSKALHDVFIKIENEIEHKFHSSDQNRKRIV